MQNGRQPAQKQIKNTYLGKPRKIISKALADLNIINYFSNSIAVLSLDIFSLIIL